MDDEDDDDIYAPDEDLGNHSNQNGFGPTSNGANVKNPGEDEEEGEEIEEDGSDSVRYENSRYGADPDYKPHRISISSLSAKATPNPALCEPTPSLT